MISFNLCGFVIHVILLKGVSFIREDSYVTLFTPRRAFSGGRLAELADCTKPHSACCGLIFYM